MTRTATAESDRPGTLPAALRGVARVAFFDVDETLIHAKSMIDFDGHWSRTAPHHRPGTPLPDLIARLRADGAGREEQNRAYYRRFAGVPLSELTAAGESWYRALRRTDYLIARTAAALERHRGAGEGVVLLSGSLHACLDPMARELGAHLVLCTAQHVSPQGILTGEIVTPMIGQAKSDAAHALLRSLGLTWRNATAYGDHATDLPLLRSARVAYVVGDDPELAAAAQEFGWHRLPREASLAPCTE